MFQVTEITDFEVTIEDENRNISHVWKRGDGKWCCMRCNRLRCEHVKFVVAEKVQLLPRKPVTGGDVEILAMSKKWLTQQ